MVTEAPDHFVKAILGGPIAREPQQKFVRNRISKCVDPHSAAGNIRNEAIPRAIPCPSWIFAKRSRG